MSPPSLSIERNRELKVAIIRRDFKMRIVCKTMAILLLLAGFALPIVLQAQVYGDPSMPLWWVEGNKGRKYNNNQVAAQSVVLNTSGHTPVAATANATYYCEKRSYDVIRGGTLVQEYRGKHLTATVPLNCPAGKILATAEIGKISDSIGGRTLYESTNPPWNPSKVGDQLSLWHCKASFEYDVVFFTPFNIDNCSGPPH